MNNVTTATRTENIVYVHRVTDDYDGLGLRDQVATALGTWAMKLDQAKQVRYLIVVRHGKIMSVVTTLAAEQVPDLYLNAAERAERRKPRVQFAALFTLPKWAEDLIGTDVPFVFDRNPVRYGTVNIDVIEDTATLTGINPFK